MPRIHALALLGLLAASCGKDEAPDCPRPRNVLLLVADTLRADRLGCYGYPRETSPNIDALAARGTVYERAYSQACWTVPSMISMMTGVSVTVEETVLPDVAVLAEVLRDAGLETAAFPANNTLFAERGFERGYEFFEPSPNVNGPALAARFEAWLGAREDSERPFFAWVQFIDPHDPYEPAPEHDLFSGERVDEALLTERWRAEDARAAELAGDIDQLDLDAAIAGMRRESNLYDGEVRAVDDGVGRILAALQAAGALDDTLVILCADHGEMLYEHETPPYLVRDRIEKTGGLPEGVKDLFGRGHRTWYYEELWNTPFILAGPGIPVGRSSGLVANLDIYPTVLDALDLGARPWLEGKSLWCGAEPAHERVFAHGHLTSAVVERSGLKLVRYGKTWFLADDAERHPTEMFDLGADPDEGRDLSGAQPEERDRLEAEILRWQLKAARDARTETTDAMRDALRALGYIE